MEQNFLERIADALDRLSPIPIGIPALEGHDVFLWHANPDHLCLLYTSDAADE